MDSTRNADDAAGFGFGHLHAAVDQKGNGSGDAKYFDGVLPAKGAARGHYQVGDTGVGALSKGYLIDSGYRCSVRATEGS